MKSRYQVKQRKEEGSHSSSSAKKKGKKKSPQLVFPKPIPKKEIAISYIPYWIKVKGVRHMTEGRLGESFSDPERS
jgi:hypothetical protein